MLCIVVFIFIYLHFIHFVVCALESLQFYLYLYVYLYLYLYYICFRICVFTVYPQCCMCVGKLLVQWCWPLAFIFVFVCVFVFETCVRSSQNSFLCGCQLIINDRSSSSAASSLLVIIPFRRRSQQRGCQLHCSFSSLIWS